MQISVKSNIKDVKKDWKRLSKDIASKATVRALNLTATRANTQLVRRISKESGLKQKYIRDKIQRLKADKNSLTARIKPTSRLNTNLIEWVTKAQASKWLDRKGKRTKRGKAPKLPAGVTANAWRRRQMYEGTFVIKGKYSGKPVVVARKNNNRTGWSRTIYGPAVWTEFSRYSEDEARKAVDKHFEKEWSRQVKLLADRGKR